MMPFLLLWSFATLCLPPDWVQLRQALMEYERQHIHPVWQAQHQRLHKQISEKERKQLTELRLAYTDAQKALNAWLQKPTLPTDRDKILRKIQEIKNALLPIQEKHEALLATFVEERNAKKGKWRADMQAIIERYNAQIDNDIAPFFAKYNFGIYDDEDLFLLYEPEQKKEDAAGGKDD
jgi:hypothetical protein